jgi:hypothetical protein
MKKVLELAIDESLYSSVAEYASKHQMKVDDLVEHYFKIIVANSKKKNIIALIDELDTPSIDVNLDLKKEYYKNKANPNGI